MKDPLLFTPGPLTTSATVKAAMQRDIGSRDADFVELVASIRSELRRIAGVARERGCVAVRIQGSGTVGLESVDSAMSPLDGTVVVQANGVYWRGSAAFAGALRSY